MATNGTYLHDINDAGEMVGFFTDSANSHGFLHSNGSFTTLDDPLAIAGTFAMGINASGEIVGWYGAAPSVPEPSTWAMLLIGFAGIGSMIYRRSTTSHPRHLLKKPSTTLVPTLSFLRILWMPSPFALSAII